MEQFYTLSLKSREHKRKISTQMIVTSSAVDGKVKPVALSSGMITFLSLLISIVIGGGAGYIFYQHGEMQSYRAAIGEQAGMIAQLQAENSSLETEVTTLNDRVKFLSTTVNNKVAAEEELQKALDSQSLPTEFPLSSSATMSETKTTEEEPMLIFTATAGSSIVATASGTVTKVEKDEEYGNRVTIDHGNGYVTIYRNKGDVMVKEGDTVAGGNTLFVVTSKNLYLGYMMQYEENYIDPMDMLSISG